MDDEAFLFRPKYPLHMVWLATNLCNARCLHCSSDSARALAHELTTDEALKMCDELADCGVVDLAISGGEPLLRRDLLAIVAHAKKAGLAVGVGTNGANLQAREAAALADAGLDRLQVSLDGCETSHDELRSRPGLFKRALRTMARAQQGGLRVHVCFTITRGNVGDLERVADLVAKVGVRRLNLSRFVATGRGTSALELPDQAWQGVIRRGQDLRERFHGRLDVVTHLAQQVLVDKEAAAMRSFIGCQAGVAQGCIRADGTVLPCVLLPVPVGNIRHRPFGELWAESPLIRALRDRSRLEGACRTCDHRARCGGCRAVAFARTGNVFAEDPRCWLVSRDTGPVRRGLPLVS